MNRESNLSGNQRENASFTNLILAFFTPLDIDTGKRVINSAMISAYAALYMIRNGIAALTTCAVGALLMQAGYTLAGTLVIGLFVLFAGLFSAFLAATVDGYRNPR
ncbi:MAG: hypothetical protein P8Z75_07690 [Gammaproteobacteria bacterium]|jgi:hypothetical protein